MFELGRVVITRSALEFCEAQEVQPMDFLRRHVQGDWGDLCSSDKALNNAAVQDGSRILSAYHAKGEKFYVITEWNRSVTTIMLASDY